MTERDLARLWSQYVKELAVLLVLADGPQPPPEVVERVQELVQRELLLLYIRCAHQHFHAQRSIPSCIPCCAVSSKKARVRAVVKA